MYDIIKNIIQNGMFKVSDLTTKIDTLWAESKLSDDERNELVQMMTDFLNPSTEAPELKDLYERLEARVVVLEGAVKELQGGGEEEPEPREIAIPTWVPWDGISDNYQYGAIVEHSEKYWQNMLQGVQNTWEPGAVGVDDRYWKEITKEEAEKLVSGQTDQ